MSIRSFRLPALGVLTGSLLGATISLELSALYGWYELMWLVGATVGGIVGVVVADPQRFMRVLQSTAAVALDTHNLERLCAYVVTGALQAMGWLLHNCVAMLLLSAGVLAVTLSTFLVLEYMVVTLAHSSLTHVIIDSELSGVLRGIVPGRYVLVGDLVLVSSLFLSSSLSVVAAFTQHPRVTCRDGLSICLSAFMLWVGIYKGVAWGVFYIVVALQQITVFLARFVAALPLTTRQAYDCVQGHRALAAGLFAAVGAVAGHFLYSAATGAIVGFAAFVLTLTMLYGLSLALSVLFPQQPTNTSVKQ